MIIPYSIIALVGGYLLLKAANILSTIAEYAIKLGIVLLILSLGLTAITLF